MEEILKKSLKILIVDDDEVDRLAFRRIISKINKDFEVFEALDGFETLKIIKEKSFDCIFLDYRLPQWDGLKVLKEIRALDIRTPVVIITGQGDENLVMELLKVGAEDYLPKSLLSPESVLKSLEYSINSRYSKEQLKWLASFPEKSPIPIVEINYGGEITYINPVAEFLFSDLKEKIFSHPFLSGIMELIFESTHKGNIPVAREIEVEGKFYHQTISLIPDKKLVRIYAIDITERKEAEKEIFYNAYFDRLTGLFNKTFFLQRISYLLKFSKANIEYGFAVLLLNVDRFKVLNDSLGHPAGDKLIIAISDRLKSTLSPSDTISRFVGDEFGIILENLKEKFPYVVKLVEKIQGSFSKPFIIEGKEVFITVSIGINLYPEDYSNPEEVLRDTDTALNRAKGLGRAKYEIFDKEMHHKAISILNFETDLRKALEKKELDIYYQPIVNLSNGRAEGLEALVRWKHPEKGFLIAQDFIPFAEETGLITGIDRWVIEEVFRQVSQWLKTKEIKFPFYVSINLSSADFEENGLIPFIKALFEKYGLHTQNIRFEITENTLISNVRGASFILKELREMGIKIHLDDFGTGYSSLRYLQKFKVDSIKIDKSFIEGLEVVEESNEIVKTIILLSQNLKINVIAEGIERENQLKILRNLNCQYGQGFLFSEALELNKIII
ncbi:MAG: EAL domain-containing protein [Thermoanaerobaculia bacterium]